MKLSAKYGLLIVLLSFNVYIVRFTGIERERKKNMQHLSIVYEGNSEEENKGHVVFKGTVAWDGFLGLIHPI